MTKILTHRELEEQFAGYEIPSPEPKSEMDKTNKIGIHYDPREGNLVTEISRSSMRQGTLPLC